MNYVQSFIGDAINEMFWILVVSEKCMGLNEIITEQFQIAASHVDVTLLDHLGARSMKIRQDAIVSVFLGPLRGYSYESLFFRVGESIV